MDDTTRNEIRQTVEEQIRGLSRELENMQDRAQTVDLDQPIGRLSRMDSLTNQGILLSSVNKTKTRLARLKQVLKNIDDPDFGLCRECGEEIALKRIKALPESDLCIDCAE
ncbi:MAG: TraR/DksA C4-type zinc finger protein [Desulfovermiculus sp.]|nr:TraR/DksA C4-type zinc finger protein [Desulfovermiculus sp.]